MKEKILFITNLLPYPFDNGGKIKTYNTLMMLRDVYDIDLFCFIERDEDCEYAAKLEDIGVHVHWFNKTLRHQEHLVLLLWEIFKSLFLKYPYVVSKYSHRGLRSAVDGALRDKNYACVYVDHLQLFQYVQKYLMQDKRSCVVLDQHNVETDIVKRRLLETKNIFARYFLQLEITKLFRYEKESCLQADLVLAITDVDRGRIEQITGGKTQCKTAPFFIKKTQNLFSGGDGRTILFLGTMSWYPNEHGVLWFYENVFCRYCLGSQGWRLLIVGGDPGGKIKTLTADSAVMVSGRVKDIAPYLSKAIVAVVPLFIGGGMRIKILDFLSSGIPTISTSIGSEGIPVVDHENILLANTPEEFRDALNAIDAGKALSKHLSLNGLRFVENYFSFKSAKKKFLEILSDGKVKFQL